MLMRYRVTAGLVTAETELPGGGRARIDHYEGTILPADVPEEQVQTLLTRGQIEPVDSGETAEPAGGDGEPSNADIRVWAEDNGFKVSPRGKLPADVVDAYHAAHSE
jgi:hypothetical protein